MNNKAFLIDISDATDKGNKYLLLVLIFKLMVQAVRDAKYPPGNMKRYNAHSTLHGEGCYNVVDLFQTAFSDIKGIPSDGFARITTRIFLNMRGMEVSVWTSKDDMYTVFVMTGSTQIANTIIHVEPTLSDYGQEFQDLLTQLMLVEHSFIFPPYEEIKRSVAQG